MKGIFLSVIAIILIGCVAPTPKVAQEKQESESPLSFEETCAVHMCRKDHRIYFRTGNGEFEQLLDLYWPVVLNDQVSLLPGDKVYIEAELINDKFLKLKQVFSVTQPEKTIEFDFKQMEGKIDMTLAVKNPFSEIMKFHLNMMDFQGKTHHTSSCPVIAGGSVFEIWPYPIPELIVSNIRALSEKESLVCEY